MKPPIVYRCGCANRPDEEWGVLRSIRKCKFHLSSRQDIHLVGTEGGEERHFGYYGSLGCDSSESSRQPHFEQLEEALGNVFPTVDGTTVLEIGCGVSPYARELHNRGYSYVGMDRSAYAAEWSAAQACGRSIVGDFGSAGEIAGEPFDAILAAHVVEHFANAPEAIRKMFATLAPAGRIVIIVPDDSDPVNPDHHWFFTADSLARTATRIGFVDLDIAVRRRIERENFIYCHARKP